MPTNKAVFLDRDGTVIVDHGYLEDAAKVELLPGAAEALVKLRDAGYKLILITNQSGIGRGYFRSEAVERQHERLRLLLKAKGVTLDAVGICPHAPDQHCKCRKPSPELLFRAAADLNVDLTRSFMVGDKPSDIDAGCNAGCRTVLVGNRQYAQADFRTSDLAGAAHWILKSKAEEMQE